MATVSIRRFYIRSLPLVRPLHSYEPLSSASTILFNHNYSRINRSALYSKYPIYNISRQYSDKIRVNSDLKNSREIPKEKLSLLQRFKQMYRDYWYVLVPVHLVTSAGWFGGFYYLAKSGVDIVGILESWNFSEKITNSLKDSSMGYIAVSYALYKIATPLRYTVTLGGTTLSINYLKKWGYIKPVPTTDRLKEMYKERKDNIMETIKEGKEYYKERKDILGSKLELKIPKTQTKSKNDLLVKDLEGIEHLKTPQMNLKPKSKEYVKIHKKQESG